MKPNNVTRMLDVKNIQYQVVELPQEKLSAIETAEVLCVPQGSVYKTIVLLRVTKGKPILAIIPGPNEVDLKSVARGIGEKKVVIATQREAEQLTGLRSGGISPLALINRGFQMLVDASIDSSDEIYISGGELGMNIRLSSKVLTVLTDAKKCHICK